jgi:serine/threonine-protein kinase
MAANAHRTKLSELRQGAVIAGKFRLTREIAEGGVGAVWEAEHLRLGGSVAIKFLARDHLGDNDIVQRFAREARLANRLRSPHVVQVLDQGQSAAGIPYLVMEMLEGEDLAARLARRGTCSVLDTALILHQLARALSRAHAIGLVHRDIKPHNVFIITEPDGQWFVKLLDFGIAKDLSLEPRAPAQRGILLGTVHYMSPEQLVDAESVGPTSDIWSLGVLVYEMLTGVVPFDGPSVSDVAQRVAAADFEPLTKLRDLPPALDTWLRTALAPEPSARFASVDDMARAFGGIVRSHLPEVAEQLRTRWDSSLSLPIPIAAATPTAPARHTPLPSPAPLLRRSAAIWGLMLGFALLMAALTIVVRRSTRERRVFVPTARDESSSRNVRPGPVPPAQPVAPAAVNARAAPVAPASVDAPAPAQPGKARRSRRPPAPRSAADRPGPSATDPPSDPSSIDATYRGF